MSQGLLNMVKYSSCAEHKINSGVTIRGTDILCNDRVWRKEIVPVDSVFQGPLSMHMLEINISVYRCINKRIEGRKEARKQAKILVDCGTDSCGCGWATDFRFSTTDFAYLEVRMENYELCITDTDFCGFVSTDILIHTYGFLFFSGFKHSVFECQGLLLHCKLLPLYLFFQFCLEGTPSPIFSFLCSRFHLMYVPPRSILVATSGMIS